MKDLLWLIVSEVWALIMVMAWQNSLVHDSGACAELLTMADQGAESRARTFKAPFLVAYFSQFGPTS